MDQKITILVAPLLKNSSCENGNSSTFLSNLGATDVIQAFFIMTLTIAIVGANFVVIIVINCRRYASFIHPQVSVVKFVQKSFKLYEIFFFLHSRDT